MPTDDMEINATWALNNMCIFFAAPLISAGTDIYLQWGNADDSSTQN